MPIRNASAALLASDFKENLTSSDTRAALEAIADRMAPIVEIIQAIPKGLSGAALVEVDLQARLSGLEADCTADDTHAGLNAAWGIVLVASEVEAQAFTALAIDKAQAR